MERRRESRTKRGVTVWEIATAKGTGMNLSHPQYCWLELYQIGRVVQFQAGKWRRTGWQSHKLQTGEDRGQRTTSSWPTR
eukprot:14005231-Heterocapsa_arctica.AAC.1